MSKNLRLFGIALAGVGALLLPLNADATCGAAASFGSYYVHIEGTTGGPTLRANFWTMGAGNPVIGQGADTGAITHTTVSPTTPAPWIQQYGGGTVVLGDWSSLPYDGCCDAIQPNTAQRMGFSFSDVDASGNMIWAAACVARVPGFAPDFDLGHIPGGSIPLVPAVKAQVTNTVRAGTEATITVASPDFGAGFKSDGSVGCELAAVIPSYSVFRQQTARNVAPSTSNDAVAPTWVSVCTASLGQPCTFTTSGSATNSDNYLAVTPNFNSGFNTGEAAMGAAAPARLSVKSTNVQTGPTLAVTPKVKKINNGQIGPKKLAGEQ